MTQLTPNQISEVALKALHLLDLTSLNDTDTDTTIEALTASADTPVGTPAALCVYPRFVHVAKSSLASKGLAVSIATVTNFPRGESSPELAARETAAAIALGADEVDVVFPYRALMAGDALVARELVAQSRAAVGEKCLKVIIETGELREAKLIRQASEIAIDAGAHFVKTSTGKVEVNATPDAAEIVLGAIRDSGRAVGFKVAGGVRSVEDAAEYLRLAERILGPGWATPATFRFGASSLLAKLLTALGHRTDVLQTVSY